jgi:hypothetical protein
LQTSFAVSLEVAFKVPVEISLEVFLYVSFGVHFRRPARSMAAGWRRVPIDEDGQT